MIRVSKTEYERMQNRDMISQVLESEKNISSGNIKEFEY